MKYLYGILIVLFAVGDLVGQANLTRLEKRLLNRCRSIFKDWLRYSTATFKWWKVLLMVGLLNILVASLAVSSYVILLLLIHDESHFIPIALAVVSGWLLISAAYLLTEWRINFDKKIFGSLGNVEPPLESKILRYSAALPRSVIEWALARKGGSAEGAVALFAISGLVGGIISSVLISISVSVRAILGVLVMLAWIVFFLPVEVLEAIKQRTGADSFVNVGKYILLVLGALLARFGN